MKMQQESQLNREAISSLMDGDLSQAGVSSIWPMMASEDARECWHVYHLIGDVLRSDDLAAHARSHIWMPHLNELRPGDMETSTVAIEPVSAPTVVSDVTRSAANDAVFRWKMVAGLASFAAVAAIGWSVVGGSQSAPQWAQVPSTFRSAQGLTLAESAPVVSTGASADMEAGMLRDARLDELLSTHRQTSGASALGPTAGFLRNATFEHSGR